VGFTPYSSCFDRCGFAQSHTRAAAVLGDEFGVVPESESKTALLALFLRAFSKADAGPAAVLIDDFDAGSKTRWRIQFSQPEVRASRYR
jgi:hypothetical protein